MSTLSRDELLEQFRAMTLLELAEFISAFEEEFQVSGAVPVAAAGAVPVAAAEPEVEEKTAFDVVLNAVGGKKIQVIKAVRELTGLGLKEAKDAVEAAPFVVLKQVPAADAEKGKAKLEAEGAEVALV